MEAFKHIMIDTVKSLFQVILIYALALGAYWGFVA